MNDKNLLPQIAEDEDDEMKAIYMQCEENDTVTSMARTELENYNKNLEDQIKVLKDRLASKDKQHLDELEHYKQACDGNILNVNKKADFTLKQTFHPQKNYTLSLGLG